MSQPQSTSLEFRRFFDTDLAFGLSLLRDPEVMRYTSYGRKLEEVEAKELFQKWTLNPRASHGIWCVLDREKQTPVGWAMLKEKANGPSELGYMFARNFWGKGYASRVCAALVKHGIAVVGEDKLQALCLKENLASIRVLEKSGLQQISDDGKLLTFEILK